MELYAHVSERKKEGRLPSNRGEHQVTAPSILGSWGHHAWKCGALKGKEKLQKLTWSMADASPHYHFVIGFLFLFFFFHFFLLKSNSISVRFFLLLFTNKGLRGLQFALCRIHFSGSECNSIMGAGAEITALSLHCIPATPASCNNNGNDAGDWDVEPFIPDSTSPHRTMCPRYMDPSWKVCLSVYSNIINIPKMLVFFSPLSLTTQTP